MKKTFRMSLLAIGLGAVSTFSNAFEFAEENIYAGGGLAFNFPDTSSLDSAIGYQFQAGYDLKDDVKMPNKLGLAAEVGYTSSGNFSWSDCPSSFVNCSAFDFSADGLWINAVSDFHVQDQISVLGRLGLDMGDDDGIMFGFGAGYKIDEKISARVEYVIRQNYKSLQANAIYNF